MRVLKAATSDEIDVALATFAGERIDALFVGPDQFFGTRRVQFAIMASRYRMPATYALRDYVEAGGLMSYGTNISDMYRQVAGYAAKILKGAKPFELLLFSRRLSSSLSAGRRQRRSISPCLTSCSPAPTK
jgi:putative ABC transport system substrate-binding protein